MWDGRYWALASGLTVGQQYRKHTRCKLEAVYTFPLSWGSTFLGMSVEIAGNRLNGTVLNTDIANKSYEASIDDGDTPVMVEKAGMDLYTANLRNLKPGEEAVIELQYAQLLKFEQGRIRLTDHHCPAIWRRARDRRVGCPCHRGLKPARAIPFYPRT